MNKWYVLLIGLLITTSGYSQSKQPVIKAYGYLRESSPGAIPKVVNEEGKQIDTGPTIISSYQFFMESKKGVTIKPVKLWIDGKAYKVKTENVSQTPYTFTRYGVGSNKETDTLVKKTSNKVIKVIADGELLSSTIKKQHSDSPKIVLEYYSNNKKYSYSVKDIRKLSPLIFE